MDETFTVTELSDAIGRAVTHAFPDPVWVRGEIRDLNRAASGHVFFTLIDPHDVTGSAPHLPVTLFASDKDAINWKLKKSGAGRMTDGTEVRIRGIVTHYASRGTVQLRMTWIDTEFTLGRLAARREALLRVLGAEGLLERNGRLPMPLAPLRVGVATSIGSAAYADFVHELEATGFSWRLRARHTTVQGVDAPDSIVAAIEDLAPLVDVIALIRGGGAKTELAVFDDEAVARAIAGCPVPVVTGIGHETDDSVADRVAHMAFKTPTAAAAGLASVVRRFVERLVDGSRRIERAAGRALRSGERGLEGAERRLVEHASRATRLSGLSIDRAVDRMQRASGSRTAAAAARLAHMQDRVVRAGRAGLLAANRTLELAAARARSGDPGRIIARGFAIIRHSGRVVTDVAALTPGDDIDLRLRDGTASARVTGTRRDAPLRRDGETGNIDHGVQDRA